MVAPAAAARHLSRASALGVTRLGTRSYTHGAPAIQSRVRGRAAAPGSGIMGRTTIGSFLRATQAWCAQLCQKETLEYGIAYFRERFAAMPDACQFREVWTPDPARFEEAFRQTEEWFESKRSRK